MSLKSWIKGKKKVREVRKLEPDKDFNFEKEFYGNSNIIEGFNFLFCNNYTNKYCDKKYTDIISFISCVVVLPNEPKVIKDLMILLNHITDDKLLTYDYSTIHTELIENKIHLYLKGNIVFYNVLCKEIYNNIFTKYIRNNIFTDLENNIHIETPNEYLDKMYNNIKCPSKDIDILFIEDNIPFEGYQPVIGLSISKSIYEKEKAVIAKRLDDFEVNNRIIMYIQLDKLTEREINYLIENVKHGDKLINLLHQTNSNYLDIDEIIEE